jgi:RNA polymerase sigma-70 factor (ECF subfamily)
MATDPVSLVPLLPRVAAGDANAVRDCLARYGGLVFALARRFLGNATDAEDVTQDVFVELWKHASRFDPVCASEPTFVTMITRRRLIDHKRRAGRRLAPEALPEFVPERASPARFSDVDSRDDAALARQALGDLKDDQRSVILLAVDDGLTHEQIAVRTGLPVGTVKTHIRRGLMRVREALTGTPTVGGNR